MTAGELWGYLVGGLGAISIIVTILRNHKGDAANEGKSNGAVLTEIGYIKSGIDDIKRRMDRQEQNYVELVERVSKVEASSSQAHKRLDRIDKGTKE